MSRRYFYGQLPAVLRCHSSLQSLHDCVWHLCIVFKLFGAIVNGGSGSSANKLVMRGFISILESAPSTYVVNENCFEPAVFGNHIAQQSPESRPVSDLKSTFPRIIVCDDNLEAMNCGISLNSIALSL